MTNLPNPLMPGAPNPNGGIPVPAGNNPADLQQFNQLPAQQASVPPIPVQPQALDVSQGIPADGAQCMPPPSSEPLIVQQPVAAPIQQVAPVPQVQPIAQVPQAAPIVQQPVQVQPQAEPPNINTQMLQEQPQSQQAQQFVQQGQQMVNQQPKGIIDSFGNVFGSFKDYLAAQPEHMTPALPVKKGDLLIPKQKNGKTIFALELAVGVNTTNEENVLIQLYNDELFKVAQGTVGSGMGPTLRPKRKNIGQRGQEKWVDDPSSLINTYPG